MYCQQAKDKKTSQIQAELIAAGNTGRILHEMFMDLLS
jgi:hypothetical protein